jgi:hypothetical protein
MAFIGYDIAKGNVPDARETTTEAVDGDEVTLKDHKCVKDERCKSKCNHEKAKDAVKEHKCGESKYCKEKCTRDKTKDHKCVKDERCKSKCNHDKEKGAVKEATDN